MTPLLVIAVIAALEFGIWLLVYQAVVSAAGDGAREAAKGLPISGANSVATVVNNVLAVHSVTIDATPASGGDIVLEDPAAAPAVQNLNAGINCDPPSGPTLGAGEVRVTVCVIVSNGADQPVPNWLTTFGFSTAGRTIVATAYARKE